MKLWMSGEVHQDVYDAFFKTRTEIEQAINARIRSKKYGTGLKSWDVIPIILPRKLLDDYPEIAEYDQATHECEFRLHLDHSKFKQGSEAVQRKLFGDMLRQSLDYLSSWAIDNFDVDKLRSDFEVSVKSLG
jgi:hypothetical protein